MAFPRRNSGLGWASPIRQMMTRSMNPVLRRMLTLFCRPDRWVGGFPLAVFLSTLMTSLLTRAQLASGLAAQNSPVLRGPLTFSRGMRLASYADGDLLIALGTAVLLTALYLPFHLVSQRWGGIWLRRLGWILPIAAMVLVGLVHRSHLELTFGMNTGLDVDALSEIESGMSSAEFLALFQPASTFMVALPTLLLGLFGWTVRRWPVTTSLWALLLAGSVTGVSLYAQGQNSKWKPAPQVRLNPIVHVAESLWKASQKPRGNQKSHVQPLSSAQQRSLQLIDPIWRDPETSTTPRMERPPRLPAGGTTPWNVVVIVLESTGAEYVFNPTLAGRVPMPMLQELASQGWWLQSHRSTSNTSPRGLFSILSGLYCETEKQTMVTAPSVAIPSLASFVRFRDTLLLTPGREDFFFPLGFLTRSGLHEVFGFKALKRYAKRPHPAQALNDLDIVDRFVGRLPSLRPPFLAVYYSATPHYEYWDFGEDFRIIPDTQPRLNRYYDGLYVLDRMIRQIVETLREQKMLENTVLLLVGDHGEAFNQHPGNITHSRKSFEENLRVPAILWQPALFSPRTFEDPTTHADLLPTLLDALGVEVPQALIQGSSLYGPPRAERYLFSYGKEILRLSLSNPLIPLYRTVPWPRLLVT